MQKLFEKQSTIGYLIKITGIIVVAWGILIGIFNLATMSQMGGEFIDPFGNVQYSSGYGLSEVALIGFVAIIATHLLYGILIIGFGEVIDLLQKIYFKLDPKARQEWEKEQAEKEVVKKEDVPFWVETELKAYYEHQKTTFDSIETTSDAYIFKVTVDGRIEYVEVGKFRPQVLSDEEAKKYTE